MYPNDLKLLGLLVGDVVRVRSKHGSILAGADADDGLRCGLVSMTHGFGVQGAKEDQDPRVAGINVNLLIGDEFDPLSGYRA